MRKPISSELPSSLSEGLKKEHFKDLEGNKPQLRRVCHRPCSRVRTAGNRGHSSLAEPLANPQLAESLPPRLALCQVLLEPRTPVLLHRLFPDFSLTQLTSTLVSSTTQRPCQFTFPQLSFKVTTTTTNRSHPTGVVGMSFIRPLSASKLREYRVSVTHRVDERHLQRS